MQQRMTNLQEALRQLEEEAEEAVEDTTRLEPANFSKSVFFFWWHLSSEIIPKIGGFELAQWVIYPVKLD